MICGATLKVRPSFEYEIDNPAATFLVIELTSACPAESESDVP